MQTGTLGSEAAGQEAAGQEAAGHEAAVVEAPVVEAEVAERHQCLNWELIVVRILIKRRQEEKARICINKQWWLDRVEIVEGWQRDYDEDKSIKNRQGQGRIDIHAEDTRWWGHGGLRDRTAWPGGLSPLERIGVSGKNLPKGHISKEERPKGHISKEEKQRRKQMNGLNLEPGRQFDSGRLNFEPGRLFASHPEEEVKLEFVALLPIRIPNIGPETETDRP